MREQSETLNDHNGRLYEKLCSNKRSIILEISLKEERGFNAAQNACPGQLISDTAAFSLSYAKI